jgi:carboxyl-terminal processing protease
MKLKRTAIAMLAAFSVAPLLPAAESADDGLAVFLESLDIISKRAVDANKHYSRKQLLKESLQALLSRLDAHSQFLTAEEYLRFKANQENQYLGLGLELEISSSGAILCFPYPGSPAQKAGVKAADRLIAVNGESVTHKALPAIGVLASGKVGDSVNLTVATAKQNPRNIKAILAESSPVSVTHQSLHNLTILKIAFFSADTVLELSRQLEKTPASMPLVLDLRDNTGGDFYAALEAADLFLAEGKILAYAVNASGQTPYKSSSRSKKYPKRTLSIWQNQVTASAAEVFIAALTENNAALSIGPTSYGKGSKQSIIELSDGAALFLTTDYLATPQNHFYNGKGLKANYPLAADKNSQADYLLLTQKRLNSN